MGCFGFSLRKLPKKKLSDQYMEEDVVKNGGLKKKTRWISCSGFRRKKSAVKTVPVHSPASDISGSKELQSLKSMKKVSSKKHKQATGVDMIPAAGLDQTINNKAHKKRFEIDKAIILENGDQLDHSNSLVQDDTWQKPSSRKRENKKTGSSRLFTKNLSKRTTTLLPHSISLPGPKRKKQKAISIKDDNAIREIDQKFDPLIGMSILVVTLVIMLLWGKLCAILCTSAWFFMVPRLKTVVNSTVNVENGSDSGGPDLNSDEYKKKVVLEGFLQRNRRSVTGIL